MEKRNILIDLESKTSISIKCSSRSPFYLPDKKNRVSCSLRSGLKCLMLCYYLSLRKQTAKVSLKYFQLIVQNSLYAFSETY
ncbi:hypothetical protein ASE92_19650 [Pedobacter sp. Leaf41]|nr:hypothetical protein ASE92_19650 [Pedobacter sp. Leaf41]